MSLFAWVRNAFVRSESDLDKRLAAAIGKSRDLALEAETLWPNKPIGPAPDWPKHEAVASSINLTRAPGEPEAELPVDIDGHPAPKAAPADHD